MAESLERRVHLAHPILLAGLLVMLAFAEKRHDLVFLLLLRQHASLLVILGGEPCGEARPRFLRLSPYFRSLSASFASSASAWAASTFRSAWATAASTICDS
jgi:hypothetical protein